MSCFVEEIRILNNEFSPMITRRHFLRAAGASLALPAIARAAESMPPRRLVAIHVPLGMMPDLFFPKPGEATSPYLDLLAAHRSHFTTFVGLSHPEVNGNHHAGQCFLTGAPHPGQPTFRNSLSMDQIRSRPRSLAWKRAFPISVSP